MMEESAPVYARSLRYDLLILQNQEVLLYTKKYVVLTTIETANSILKYEMQNFSFAVLYFSIAKESLILHIKNHFIVIIAERGKSKKFFQRKYHSNLEVWAYISKNFPANNVVELIDKN